MQVYLNQKNLEQYKPTYSKPNLLTVDCLPIVKYKEFNLKVGFPFTAEIAAGSVFFQMIEVEHPGSIIYVGFGTSSYDIQFAFFRVTEEARVSGEDEVNHVGLEEIYPLTKIEACPNPVKVTFIAREAGIYKVLWSNEHSWFTAKTLRYRVSVLKPASQTHADIHEIKAEPLVPKKKRPMIALIQVPKPSIDHLSSIGEHRRKDVESWQERVTLFLHVDSEN